MVMMPFWRILTSKVCACVATCLLSASFAISNWNSHKPNDSFDVLLYPLLPLQSIIKWVPLFISPPLRPTPSVGYSYRLVVRVCFLCALHSICCCVLHKPSCVSRKPFPFVIRCEQRATHTHTERGESEMNNIWFSKRCAMNAITSLYDNKRDPIHHRVYINWPR